MTMYIKNLVGYGLAACVLSLPLQAQQLVWTDDSANVVQSANVDGSNLQTISSGGGAPRGVAIDQANSHVYWANAIGPNSIFRIDFDGSNQTVVVTGEAPRGIALDLINSKIYWTDNFSSVDRSDLNGSNIENLISGQSGNRSIAVDPAGGKMYWTVDSSTDQIFVANLDGTGSSVLLSTSDPNYVALDLINGKIYWSQQNGTLLQRANLSDGSNIETVADIVGGQTEGIALDPANSFVYFGDSDNGSIRRVNYDGTGLTTIVSGLSSPHALAFIPEPSTYALLVGALAIGLALYYRKSKKVSLY